MVFEKIIKADDIEQGKGSSCSFRIKEESSLGSSQWMGVSVYGSKVKEDELPVLKVGRLYLITIEDVTHGPKSPKSEPDAN